MCEGEWDAIATAWLFQKTGTDAVVVGVPGAGTFKAVWDKLLKGRKVRLLYDPDAAGRAGDALAWIRLQELPMNEISSLHWPKGTADTYDVRDFVIEWAVKNEEPKTGNCKRYSSRSPCPESPSRSWCRPCWRPRRSNWSAPLSCPTWLAISPRILSATSCVLLEDHRTAGHAREHAESKGDVRLRTAVAWRRLDVPLEAGEAYAVREFGSTTSISFQAITNDASGILNAAGRAIADVALRTISAEVYRVLAANAVRLEDSVALFATSHPSGSNLKTGSLDAAGLGAAVAAVRDQKSMTGEPLNLKPTHLLCASSEEAAARELVGGWQEPLAVLTETRIPSGTYFVIARDWPGLQIETLFGDLAPVVTPTSSNDLRSKNFNAVLSFGTSMTDHRGWCKTTA